MNFGERAGSRINLKHRNVIAFGIRDEEKLALAVNGYETALKPFVEGGPRNKAECAGLASFSEPGYDRGVRVYRARAVDILLRRSLGLGGGNDSK